MMVVRVDEEVCIGCGQCEEIYPEVFEIDDEKACVIVNEIPDDVMDVCKETVESCPVDAITLEEEEL